MSKKPRDNRPYIPPVKRVLLSEENTRQRMILIVIFLAIAVTAFAYGISAILETEAGWQVIKGSPSEPAYHGEFVLKYDFSEMKNPSAGEKRLSALYTEAQMESYQLFSPDGKEESRGIAFLNAHPNEAVEVHPALYDALSLAVRYENRHLFTAPAAGAYSSLFLSQSDEEAALLDPELDADSSAWLSQVASFASDPSAASLELHGENRVTLRLSEEYQAFARDHEITTFLDFGWMRNAFVADHIAEALLAQGFTSGYLASYDGFTRNLDGRGEAYSQNLYHRNGRDIYQPARLRYTGPMALVTLRDYPMTSDDQWHYYAYASGRIVSVFLDPMTCRSGSAIDGLTAYSRTASCGEMLLQLAPVFTGETFAAASLTGRNFDALWCEGKTLYHTEESADLELLTDMVTYSAQSVS